MFRQLTQAMSGAATLSAHVMAKAIAVPVDTALWARETTSRKPPQWHSRNEVVLASPFALLRDFSAGDDDVVPTLLFPPLAGHASCIIDKNGQSQVQLCITTGLTKVYSFDWLSATSATKDTTEDDRLDFITRAVDLIAGPEGTVNIAGDCQGGWEATLWAALHPGRVNTLVVAGAPIDTSAGDGPARQLMPILVPARQHGAVQGHGQGLRRHRARHQQRHGVHRDGPGHPRGRVPQGLLARARPRVPRPVQ